MAWISKVTRGQGTSIVDPDMVIVDSEDEVVGRYKIWHSISDINAVGSSYLQSNENGAYLQLSFKGSALWVRFRLGPDCGKAKVTVDDEERYIDLYSDAHVFAYVNVAVGLSPDVDHTVKIEVTDSKNPSSTNYYVRVDSFAYRTAEQAISQWGVEYVDLINQINTINTINKIVTIGNISSIGLLETVENVSSIGLIEAIGNVSAVATIGNISSVERVGVVENISSIGKINTIENVSNIGTINVIHEIGRVRISESKSLVVKNPSFETGNLDGWNTAYVPDCGTITVTDAKAWEGKYSAKINTLGDVTYTPLLWQPIAIRTDYVDFIRIKWYGSASTAIQIRVVYDDNTIDDFDDRQGLAPCWRSFVIDGQNLPQGKRIEQLRIWPKPLEDVNTSKSFFVDNIQVKTSPCKVSGETIIAKISGETVVAEVSGQTVIGKVSGETVDIVTPTVVKTYATRVISSVSGGEPLHSGAVKSVIIKALGTFYVGGDQNGYYPYSGYGFLMVSGEALNLDVDDFSRVRLFAVNSGEMVTFLGVY